VVRIKFGWLDFGKNTLEPYAGTRAEARIDGNIKGGVFVVGTDRTARSCGSPTARRTSSAKLIFKMEVLKRWVGGDLFQFGDKDGEGDDAFAAAPARRRALRRENFDCRYTIINKRSTPRVA